MCVKITGGALVSDLFGRYFVMFFVVGEIYLLERKKLIIHDMCDMMNKKSRMWISMPRF